MTERPNQLMEANRFGTMPARSAHAGIRLRRVIV
jgi:hypothetical protein